MSDIKNVSVIGAGVLGAQIAFVAAHSGFKVTVWELNDETAEAAKGRFDSIGKQMIEELDSATEETVAAAHDNLHVVTDVAEAVKEADLVIEAVPEKLDLKKDMWAKVGAAAPETAILLTNTSTLLPSSFAEATGAPERFLALHFANHIWLRNTAEVMPHAGTDKKYVDIVAQFASDMTMRPVVLKKEQPGYILNSLLVPFLEAGQMLYATGVADPDQIDLDWRNSTGSPMGPFEAMDLVGLRTVLSIADQPDIPEWKQKFVEDLKERIAAGKTGKESGEGFYSYK